MLLTNFFAHALQSNQFYDATSHTAPVVSVSIFCKYQDFAVTKRLKDSSKPILSVAWRGDFLATGCMDCKVRIYNGSKDLGLESQVGGINGQEQLPMRIVFFL